MSARSLCLAVLVLVICGCRTGPVEWVRNGFKVGPNYVQPSAPTAPTWIDEADPRVKSDPAIDCAWWSVFQDPVLDGLIQSAARQNLDLRTAGARILEARAQRNIAIGNLFPQTQTLNASDFHIQISQNLQLPNTLTLLATGFNLSWEADFWGRYRRTIESANANVKVADEKYGEVLVILLADVARAYVQFRTYQQRLEFARNNVEIQRGSLALAESRFQKGASSELDVTQARSNLEQTASSIPVLEIGMRRSSNALCILLGLPPAAPDWWLGIGPIPIAPSEVALGVPADLLRRRPDVRRAERQVAAQSAQIGIAESDLYPRFYIEGFAGYVGHNFNELFEAKSFTGVINPTAHWSILNYGRIVNNIAMQDARLLASALQYQQAVLRADQEVEDGLIGFLRSQTQAGHLQVSVASAARSVDLATIQFTSGVTDFNRVFNTQSLLVTQQDQLAVARGNIALNLVNVYQALGGGWQAFANGGSMAGNGPPPPIMAGAAQGPPGIEYLPAPQPSPIGHLRLPPIPDDERVP